MIFAHIKTSTLFGDGQIGDHFFIAVNGGLVGMSAPSWTHHFSPAVITGMILSIALAIFTSGWLMGQPHRAQARARQWTIRQQSLGAVAGTLSGAGIGIVYAITTILLSHWFAVANAFVIVLCGCWRKLDGSLRHFCVSLNFPRKQDKRARCAPPWSMQFRWSVFWKQLRMLPVRLHVAFCWRHPADCSSPHSLPWRSLLHSELGVRGQL